MGVHQPSPSQAMRMSHLQTLEANCFQKIAYSDSIALKVKYYFELQ